MNEWLFIYTDEKPCTENASLLFRCSDCDSANSAAKRKNQQVVPCFNIVRQNSTKSSTSLREVRWPILYVTSWEVPGCRIANKRVVFLIIKELEPKHWADTKLWQGAAMPSPSLVLARCPSKCMFCKHVFNRIKFTNKSSNFKSMVSRKNIWGGELPMEKRRDQFRLIGRINAISF